MSESFLPSIEREENAFEKIEMAEMAGNFSALYSVVGLTEETVIIEARGLAGGRREVADITQPAL